LTLLYILRFKRDPACQVQKQTTLKCMYFYKLSLKLHSCSFICWLHFAKAQEPPNANIGFDTSQNKAVNLKRQIVTSAKILEYQGHYSNIKIKLMYPVGNIILRLWI